MEKRKYEQLSLRERIEIYRLHADGKSLRSIAGVLERSASTVSRELRRNSKASKQWTGGYDPQRAQQLTSRRHARGRAHKLERQPELREKVLQHLAAGWSPEQIAGRMARSPGSGRISHESIYRYIYWRSWSFNETLHRWLPRRKYPPRKASAQWRMVDGVHIGEGFHPMIVRRWWKPERARAIGRPTS
jgi:IS30 family transposase